MTDPFIRPLARDARILVELEGRPLERYAVMLHEKQPAERFAEGSPSEVAPMAIRYLIDHWEAIAEAWKS